MVLMRTSVSLLMSGFPKPFPPVEEQRTERRLASVWRAPVAADRTVVRLRIYILYD